MENSRKVEELNTKFNLQWVVEDGVEYFVDSHDRKEFTVVNPREDKTIGTVKAETTEELVRGVQNLLSC